MSILSTIRFIANHPLNHRRKTKAIFRFLKWQLNPLLNPYPVIYPFTDRSKLIIQKGMTGATGNLYCGLHEYEDMFFLLHFLRKEDLFIDIGANIGSYTVLASAHAGADCISIEPVPSTYNHLVNNIKINGIHDKVIALNIALGSQEGSLKFTKNLDTTNHVATDDESDTFTVNVSTLDTIVLDKKVPALLKIDVEGFETEVLSGGGNTLFNNELKAVIIELNGSGTRYNYDESLIHEKFMQLGFNPYIYNPLKRELKLTESFGFHSNTIYVRDIALVEERIKKADKVKVLDDLI